MDRPVEESDMGLAPGRRAPDFELIERDRRTTFDAWRKTRWGLFLTRPQDFTSSSICRAASMAAQRGFFLLALEPLASAAPFVATFAGAIVHHANGTDMPFVSDRSGKIATQWAGVAMEVGPAEPDPVDSIAYVIDDRGTIRLTYSFIPDFQHDLMDAMTALEALHGLADDRSRATLRAA